MGDLFTIIENIAGVVPALQTLVIGVLFILGLVMIMLSLGRMAKLSQGGSSRVQGMTGPLVTFLIGVLFVGFGSVSVSMFSATFLGDDTIHDASEILSFAPSTLDFLEPDSRALNLFIAITTIIQLIGLIALARGLLVLNETAQGTGQARVGSGVVFVVAGVCALNFPLFLSLVENLVT